MELVSHYKLTAKRPEVQPHSWPSLIQLPVTIYKPTTATVKDLAGRPRRAPGFNSKVKACPGHDVVWAGRRSITPLILNLCSRWNCVVDFTLRTL